MPIFLYADDVFSLTQQEVEELWSQTLKKTTSADEVVAVQCVSEEEIQRLNARYRKKDAPTNVLTFSYPDAENETSDTEEHDIALCMSVAKREAKERGATLRDYVALLLVHAFLHAVGMDHEESQEQARATIAFEQDILRASGFTPISL